MKTSIHFGRLIEQVKVYVTKNQEICNEYAREKARINRTYQPAVAAEHMDKLKVATRVKFDIAGMEVGTAAEVFIETMQKQLSAMFDPSKTQAQMETLRVLRDFGVKLSERELRLVAENCTDYLSLRALSTIAEQSGFTMTVPRVDAFLRDLDIVKGWFCGEVTICTPQENAEAIVDVYERLPLKRADGSVYAQGDVIDTVWLAASAEWWSGVEQRLFDMGTAWGRLLESKELCYSLSATSTDAEKRAAVEALEHFEETRKETADTLIIEELDANAKH